MTAPVVRLYQAGALAARVLPGRFTDAIAAAGGVAAARASSDRRRQVERNLRRIDAGASAKEIRRGVDATFAAYARYWAESFRLPSLPFDRVDGTFTYEGYDHVIEARRRGTGAIAALPHLGGWEWAAFWLTAVEHVPVTAVVEALEPPELFEWFASFRRELGMTVVGLGPEAAAACVRALRSNDVLCLLSDRDIGGGGVDVEFFGERTTLPAGPATLALRTGAPILPTAIYLDGPNHHAVVEPPLDTTRQGSLRDDVGRITQDLALRLEALIRRAPDQWHLLSPNWPSDRGEVVAPPAALP